MHGATIKKRQGKVTRLSKQQVQTDRNIPSNNPDIIIRDSEKGTHTLIDDVISGDRNVIKKEAGNILKYSDLITEIQHTWNVKANVTSIIIGTT
jgi:hypothetical protein